MNPKKAHAAWVRHHSTTFWVFIRKQFRYVMGLMKLA